MSYQQVKVDMAPVSKNLKHFKVYESNHQVMIVATDRYQEEYHVIRFEKVSDVLATEKMIEDIMNEEIKTFNRMEIKGYINSFKTNHKRAISV
jgi:uncharacterized protein YdeI (YjbR/CyaY-like superfamily)